MNGVPPVADGLIANLLAFLTGALLYAMLIALVVHGARTAGRHWWSASDRLPLLTGAAGLLWNLGGLLTVGLVSPLLSPAVVWMQAIAFTALGTLPAFIVHSLFQGGERVAGRDVRVGITLLAYAVPLGAGALNGRATMLGEPVPATSAVWLLTIGFTALTAVVLVLTRRGPVGRRGIWVAALSIFALSAFHFENHSSSTRWWLELLLHHASIPLALAILHQDYRFAFVDLFLKYALALVALMGLSASVWSLVLLPLVDRSGDTIDPRATASAVLLWAATALCFPLLVRAAGRLVDRVVLRRADYERTVAGLTESLERAQSEADVRDVVTAALVAGIRASDIAWREADPLASDAAMVTAGHAVRGEMTDPIAQLRPDTVTMPRVLIRIGTLAGGRRLLSDDLRLLEEVTRLTGRRLDALRMADARTASSVREQQMQRLATEAELRALRAQINPHFLFNALTTVGYLIQTAPDRALSTLLKLTGVLRGVLRQSQVDLVPLRDELSLVRAYLDIEVARFEDRLRVIEQVDPDTLEVQVPPLVLQPLVENAVKHGIAPLRQGGTVTVSTRRDGATVCLAVADTGAGVSKHDGEHHTGVGLQNIERRLDALYGSRASITISSTPGRGTIVTLHLPVAVEEPHGHRPPSRHSR
jgi:two-component system LytT family sensor kinase